jgi:hypothetical protein
LDVTYTFPLAPTAGEVYAMEEALSYVLFQRMLPNSPGAVYTMILVASVPSAPRSSVTVSDTE